MPNLFLVGAPKCGTTSLHAYLAQHFDVFMASKKEPHFWSTDLHRPNRMRPADYFDLFNDAAGYSQIGEGSTEYIYSRAACEQIQKFFPRARIIIMLRNPVDKIYSGHAQRVRRGWESRTDFEEALEADGRGSQARSDRKLLTYRESARYAKYVRMYIEAFGRDQVHVVIFEEFVSDIPRQFKEVCRFLDIAPDFPIQFKTFNPRKGRRLRALSKLIGPASEVRRIGKALPQGLQAMPRTVIRSLEKWNMRDEKPRPMARVLRQRLEDEFAEDVGELSSLLGVDLLALWFNRRSTQFHGERESSSAI